MTGDSLDIVDYLVRCAHKIWEEKGIGLIYTHYTHNCRVHTSDGTIYGRDKVIEETIQALAAFPDMRILGDELIWSGNNEEGFWASHRVTCVAHNTGYSVYGPPTGRKMVRRTIANRFVKANRIAEEWVARS